MSRPSYLNPLRSLRGPTNQPLYGMFDHSIYQVHPQAGWETSVTVRFYYVKPVQKLFPSNLHMRQQVLWLREVRAEPFPNGQGRVQPTIFQCSKVQQRTKYGLFGFDREHKHVVLLVFHLNRQGVLETWRHITFFKNRSMRAICSDNEHNVSFAHLNYGKILTSIGEALKLPSLNERVINSALSSFSFYVQSFYHFEKRHFCIPRPPWPPHVCQISEMRGAYFLLQIS